MINTMIKPPDMVILYFIILCVAEHFFYRNSALTAFEHIRTKFDLYPKHYSMPPRWMRKSFKLKKKEMPKFLIFRLYVAAAVLFYMPIAIFTCLISSLDKSLVSWLMVLLPAFCIVDTTVFLIVDAIFSRYK